MHQGCKYLLMLLMPLLGQITLAQNIALKVTSWPWSPLLVKTPSKHQLMYLQQHLSSQDAQDSGYATHI